MAPASEPLAGLPQSLAIVVKAIGFAATLKLVEQFGGVRIYVPLEEHLNDTAPLVQAIGIEAARKLSREYASETLELPRAAAYLRGLRDRTIRAAFKETSAAKLAREWGTTRRHIFRILASDDEPEEQQAGLF